MYQANKKNKNIKNQIAKMLTVLKIIMNQQYKKKIKKKIYKSLLKI